MPSTAEIGAEWLFKRGTLHDATVVSARFVAGNVEVEINDEWINERGLRKPEGEYIPIILTFVSATVLEGALTDCEDGWLSELVAEEAGKYRFVFKGREALVIDARKLLYTKL